jgi:hypothetical protein
MGDPWTSGDFEKLKYSADREHELKLNEFTHNLEMEQLKLLILLNGGAAAALLAFAEKAASGRTLGWLMAPVALWLVGLGLGAVATLTMRDAQALFAKAYRHRRQAADTGRLPIARAPAFVPTKRDAALLMEFGKGGGREGQDGDSSTVRQQRLADASLYCAGTRNEKVKPLSLWSVAFFMSGAVAAGAVIILVPPTREATSTRMQTAAPDR